MYKKKIEEDLDCGIRVAFKVFGGKWKLCILDAINRGIVRPAAIKKEIKIATLRVIEMQLAELLAHKVICKNTIGTFPKKSEYELTDFGKSILPLLLQIDSWGAANAAFVRSREEDLGELTIAID